MVYDHIKALNLSKAAEMDESHQLVQPHSDELSCLAHAYLHRVEGDLSNAQYWYNRAESTMPDNTLDEELKRLYLRLIKSINFIDTLSVKLF